VVEADVGEDRLAQIGGSEVGAPKVTLHVGYTKAEASKLRAAQVHVGEASASFPSTWRSAERTGCFRAFQPDWPSRGLGHPDGLRLASLGHLGDPTRQPEQVQRCGHRNGRTLGGSMATHRDGAAAAGAGCALP